jgi:Leucine-rich repeat (LRR) protein
VNLRELDLFKNEFTGNISTEIWSLKNLKYLNLSSNNLMGEIPKESYAFLRLDLSRNQLKGKIPFQLEKFKINPQIDTEKKEYDLLVENELNE